MSIVGIVLRITIFCGLLAFIIAGSKPTQKWFLKKWKEALEGEDYSTLKQKALVGILLLGVTWQNIALLWNMIVNGNIHEVSLLGIIPGIPANIFFFIWYVKLHKNISLLKKERIARRKTGQEQKEPLLLTQGKEQARLDQLQWAKSKEIRQNQEYLN